MITIVIITHGHFGKELYLSAEMILGKQDHIHTIEVEPGRALAEIADQLDTITNNGKDSGVLMLTDMFGGSPSNVAFSYSGHSHVEIVSGINLPMLIKAISGRMSGELLKTLAKGCSRAGKGSIKVASELIK